MLTHRHAMRGFSLVELMVAVALLAVVLRIAVPAFSTMMANAQVRSAAESVLDGVSLARTEAVRRNRNVKFELSGAGWLVGCETPDATLVAGEEACPATIQQRSGNEGSPNASVATTQVNATTKADDGALPVTNTLTFTSLGRVSTGTLPAGKLAYLRVTNPTGGTCAASGGEMRCLTVVVSSGGQVRMCDPAVSSTTDPRAC